MVRISEREVYCDSVAARLYYRASGVLSALCATFTDLLMSNSRLAVGTVAIVIIVVGAVVGGILGARANTYPNYYKVEYKLQDTCELFTQIFDHHEYY